MMDNGYEYPEEIGVRSMHLKKRELKITKLELFDRYPGNYRKFKRQYRLYLCANKESYPKANRKSCLSYHI